jgi:uncharacterized membrane protein YsdA (DUF1294 family)
MSIIQPSFFLWGGIYIEQTLSYFLLILCGIACVIGFILAGLDKKAAKKGTRRTPERSFVALSLLGGGLGVLAGFYHFRHKTKHAKLLFFVWAAAIASYAAVGFCLYGLYITQ